MTREKSAKNLAASSTAKTPLETKSGASQKKTSCGRQNLFLNPKNYHYEIPCNFGGTENTQSATEPTMATHASDRQADGGTLNIYIRAHASLRG